MDLWVKGLGAEGEPYGNMCPAWFEGFGFIGIWIWGLACSVQGLVFGLLG